MSTKIKISKEMILDAAFEIVRNSGMEKLSNREKNIMELRFGFISGTEKTQKEVADMLRYFTKLYIKARKKDFKQYEM